MIRYISFPIDALLTLTQIRCIQSFNHFGPLALNAPKFMKSRDPDHAHFLETFVMVMTGLSLGACTPNLKFVSLVFTHFGAIRI